MEDEKKVETKEKSPVKKKEKVEEKQSLVDLVQNSRESNSTIVGALASADLYNEYVQEVKNKELGIKLPLKYTEKDFEKMITDYLNKGAKLMMKKGE